MESTFGFEATRIPQMKTKQRIGLQNKPEQIHMIEITQSHIMHLSERYSRSYLDSHL